MGFCSFRPTQALILSVLGCCLFSLLFLARQPHDLSELQNDVVIAVPSGAVSYPTTRGADAVSSNRRGSNGVQKLASYQSYGFFDDLTDEHWTRLQEMHKRVFPNHAPDLREFSNPGPAEMEKLTRTDRVAAVEDSNKWYGQNFHVEFVCPHAIRMGGGEADGPKWVCDPYRIAKHADCLVYSVGSNGNVWFEQAVKEDLGCEIHTFDPVSSNKRNGEFFQALSEYSIFHHWGLDVQASDNGKRGSRKRVFKTLATSMMELDHVGRKIDILKIDCEWCEWTTYQDWVEVAKPQQILVETHNAPIPEASDFFFSLHDAGYLIFSKEANYINGGGGVEYGFVRVHPDFLQQNLYSKQQK